jgi:peptidoglycan/LPS O-acetylase OafA/YrhL
MNSLMNVLAYIGSAVLLIAAVFYITVALGAPLGEYVMGGKERILSKRTRIRLIFPIVLQVAAILVLLQLGGILPDFIPTTAIVVAGFVFGGFFAMNVIFNILSKSKKERRLMTPLAAVTAVCCLVLAFWKV